MKFLILSSLLVSTSAFAQSIDVKAFKTLLTQKQAILEKATPGMSKKVVTTAKVEDCQYSQTAIQTILRIEGEKMIVHSKESLTLVPSSACINAGYENYEETVVFYVARPTLSADLEALDASAASIKSLVKAGEQVTMQMDVKETDEDGNTSIEALTFKYDLTRPSFSNLILTEGEGFKTVVTDEKDVDLNTVDLRNVTFCANDDEDSSDCVQGDFSDILF
ncbi:hypothetical protein ACJVC5_01270 [Peredibacter sp. HCB2-198]|uniref:hypothetical protein n=1 Tax=Peredibacter sp. HCB2-198 TaxID=3383025 RepID=UPI0038B4A3E3